MATRTLVPKLVRDPGWMFGVNQFLHSTLIRERGLSIQDVEAVVAGFVQKSNMMAAAHEVADLTRDGRKRLLSLQQSVQQRRVPALTNPQRVGVSGPARANIVSVTEQAFGAVSEVGHRLAGMSRAPRGGIFFLLRIGLIGRMRAASGEQGSHYEQQQNNLATVSHAASILVRSGEGAKGR